MSVLIEASGSAGVVVSIDALSFFVARTDVILTTTPLRASSVFLLLGSAFESLFLLFFLYFRSGLLILTCALWMGQCIDHIISDEDPILASTET